MTEISKWLIIQETKIKLRKKNKKKKLQEQVPLLCQGVIFCSRWLFNLAIHNVTQCLRPKGKQFETVFRAHIFEHENVKPMKHIMQGQGRSPSNFRLDASLNVLFFFFPQKRPLRSWKYYTPPFVWAGAERRCHLPKGHTACQPEAVLGCCHHPRGGQLPPRDIMPWPLPSSAAAAPPVCYAVQGLPQKGI